METKLFKEENVCSVYFLCGTSLVHTTPTQYLSKRGLSFFFFQTSGLEYERVTPFTHTTKTGTTPIRFGLIGTFQKRLQQRSRSLFARQLQANHKLGANMHMHKFK